MRKWWGLFKLIYQAIKAYRNLKRKKEEEGMSPFLILSAVAAVISLIRGLIGLAEDIHGGGNGAEKKSFVLDALSKAWAVFQSSGAGTKWKEVPPEAITGVADVLIDVTVAGLNTAGTFTHSDK